jgi:hypothetical protein
MCLTAQNSLLKSRQSASLLTSLTHGEPLGFIKFIIEPLAMLPLLIISSYSPRYDKSLIVSP